MANKSRIIRLTDLDQLPPPDDHTMFSIQGGTAAELPIERNPIRFAILYRNGCTSNAWGVRVQPAGDGYIYCRDNMQAQHISLHASGKQHITIDPNSPSAGELSEKQFMNQWHAPEEGIATFRLFFPWWGTQLNAEQRNPFKSIWKKNDIFIEGHREFLTTVGFFIVRQEVNLRRKGEFPGFVPGELPLAQGKKLAVTAEWQPECGFRSVIEKGLQQVSLVEDFSDCDQGNTLGMCMTGTIGSPNSTYMVSFPATYSKRNQEPPEE